MWHGREGLIGLKGWLTREPQRCLGQALTTITGQPLLQHFQSNNHPDGGMGDGGDYGSILHNSMFWEVFLGLQPSCAAARHCFPVEWFQRILLTTVANTQPERAVQYGMDTIAIANLRKRHPDLQYSIGLYSNKVLIYLQYCQRSCNLESKKLETP